MQRTIVMLVMVCGVCRCFIVLEGMRKLTSSKKLGIICLGVSSMTDGNSFLFWRKSKFDGFFLCKCLWEFNSLCITKL